MFLCYVLILLFQEMTKRYYHQQVLYQLYHVMLSYIALAVASEFGMPTDMQCTCTASS